ncbi:DUF664 domain-containing protein [Saccharopolyspora shandongensis]|uniref:mycothiol transferase n=1 Tax=Saccharopolyspora shandongensis TaxID=418495 RepID=UPI0033DDAA97
MAPGRPSRCPARSAAGDRKLVPGHRGGKHSDRIMDDLELDSPGAQAADDYTLRWALCHVALDTARHADLLREQWDGARGW